jgi:TP901 family phage tail tape measure protein
MADVQSNIKVSIDTTEALASIKNLQRQISAFHTSMAKGGAAANAVTGQMQQNLINSINATGKFSAQMRTIKTTTESFTNSLEKNKFSMGEYFRYAGGASKTFGKIFKTEFETINKVARENVKDLQTQYIKMGRDANGAMKAIAVRPLSLDMNNLATKTMIASEKQAILNQLLKQGSTNLLNFGKNTQWAGRQLMVGFTIPLVALGSAASKTFMDMEAQAIRFKKVYGDLFTSTTESTAALEGIKTLGKEFTKYGVAVSDTVGLAAQAAAAGFKGLDLQRQTAAATKLSILGQVESQKALETTIALQNAFSMSSEDLAKNIDFLNAVENQTVLSLDDMSTAIPKAAPVIQQLGGDVKDLAFFMTAMKEGGINASEGANALKSGLASMINPTGKASAMLEGFGINIKKIVVDNKGNLKKTVVDFATALNKLDPLNRAQAIEQMFGKFQFARLSTLFANVTKDGTQAARVLDLAGASIQDLAALSEKELGITSESAMNKFKASIENLKLALVPVGEQFLKVVTPIAEFVTRILDKFNNLGDGTKKVIVILTTVVAGLGPVLLMTFGLLMNGLANIIKGFTFMKSLFNKTGQASATLGTEVKYMTTEQRNAAAVAASLDQVHKTLAQTFTSEAASVDALTRAYQRSVAAQAQFMPTRVPLGRGSIPKRAKGLPAVVGGTGSQDSELSWLMPGETVIPTAMSKKYAPLINGMIADSIPGYRKGLGTGTAVDIPGGFAAAHFGGSSYKTGTELLQMVEGIDTAYAKQIRQMVTELNGFGRKFTVFSNEVIGTSTELNRAVGKTGTGKTAPIALAKRDLIGSGAVTRDIELQRQLEAAGVPIEEIRKINKQVTTKIKDGFSKLGNKATVVAEDLDKLVNDAYSEVSKTDDRVKSARDRMRNITAVTDPRNDSRIAASKDPYTKYRKSGAYYAGMERTAGQDNVPYQKNARFKITNAMAGSVGLSSSQAAAVYNQMNEQAKIALAKLKSDAAAFNLEFQKQAELAGLKIGTSYKVGMDKSGIKDIYVESRERKSPHRLAAKDGRDDAVAYVKARRRATRAQGPVPISIVPVSTIDPRVIPFSDINTKILPSAGFDSQIDEGPMYGPRKPTRYDKTFGKAAGKLRVAGARFSNRGMGMGLSTAGLLASQMIPGTAGNVVSTISTVGFALSALEPAISGLIAKFGMARVALVGSIATAGLSIVAGMAMFKNAAKNAAEEIINSAKREAEARAGSSRAMEQFAKTFNKALPSAREFSRNNRQSIAGSGTLVDQYAKDYATKGNISAQIINQAAFKGKNSGINAIAMDVANKAAIFGLSPEDIAANIKAASDLIGADQVKVTMAVQKLLDPNGKDILKEPLSIDARINFLNKQSDPVIKAIDNKIKDIENIDFGKRNNIPGLDTKFDYKSLKEAAGKQAEINKNYGGNWWGNIKGATQQGIRLFTSNSLADMALTVRSFDDLKQVIESSLSPQTNNVVKEFSDVESTLQSTTTQLSIAFMQQTESLALLNGLYADGKITKEQYDAQMQISAENFDSLEKSSVKLIKQLMKIDKSGGLADAAIKDLGDQALATLKKSNPELFDKITESFTKLGRSAKVSIYMAYARGSLTIMDLALIPEIVKKISGQTFEMALKIVAESELSKGGKALYSSLVAQAELEVAKASAVATKAQKNLDVSAQVAADKRVAKAKAVLAQAKKDEAEAAKVNQSGVLNTDLNKYKDITDGSGKAKTAEEKYLEVLQKEIDALKAKRDAQKDANDEVQRELDLKMKLQDLANQAVEAKISGNYLKAAMLTQESQNIQMKYNQETELRKKDAEIARLEARYKAIQDGASLTPAETAKIPKKAAGGSIRGAGTGTSDSIPAYLSNGEYVIRAASVNKYGTETFDALNAGRFAIGGIAGTTKPTTGGSFGSIGGNAKTPQQRKTTLETPYDSAKRLYQESNKKVVKIPVPPIRANFATNSYKLNKEQREELRSVAQQLLKYNFKSMVVQGHADSRGGVDNDLLSLNRAKATAAYLAKLVPGTSFIPVGHGVYKPLVPNTSAENMALNRRAELFLPDKYKTIYPDFNPKKHISMLHGIGSIPTTNGVMGYAKGGQVKNNKPDFTPDPKQSFLNRFLFGTKYKDPNAKVMKNEIPFGPGGVTKIAAKLGSVFGSNDAIPILRYIERPTSANNRGMSTVLHKGVFGEDAGTFFRALSDYDMAAIAGYTRVPNPNIAKFDDAYRAKFSDVPHIVDKTVETKWSSLARRWKPEATQIFPKGVRGPELGSEASLPYLDVDAALPIGGSWIPDAVKSITKEIDFAKEIAARGGTSGGQNGAIARIIVDPMVQGLADFRSLIPGHNASHFNPNYTEGAIAPFTRYILEGIKKNAHGYTDETKQVTQLIDEYIFRAVQTSPYAQFLGRNLSIREGKQSWDQLLPIVKKANGGMVNYKLPSYNVGSSYIPQDQIAQLHKGERVLTAQENKSFSSSGPITNNITINGADKNAKQIAQEVMVELERAQKKNNKTNMVSN